MESCAEFSISRRQARSSSRSGQAVPYSAWNGSPYRVRARSARAIAAFRSSRADSVPMSMFARALERSSPRQRRPFGRPSTIAR